MPRILLGPSWSTDGEGASAAATQAARGAVVTIMTIAPARG